MCGGAGEILTLDWHLARTEKSEILAGVRGRKQMAEVRLPITEHGCKRQVGLIRVVPRNYQTGPVIGAQDPPDRRIQVLAAFLERRTVSLRHAGLQHDFEAGG